MCNIIIKLKTALTDENNYMLITINSHMLFLYEVLESGLSALYTFAHSALQET
jgi:hypothetical protein